MRRRALLTGALAASAFVFGPALAAAQPEPPPPSPPPSHDASAPAPTPVQPAQALQAPEAPQPTPPPLRAPQGPLVPTKAPAVEDDGPKCDQAFIERVYRATKPSVVRITRPDGSLGTGFVFFTNQHVATALHVVDLGRDLRVEFPGGKTTTAQVVATDEEHDLAILELAEPTDAKPLVPRTHIPVGAPILAIGNPYGDLPKVSHDLEGLLNFSVSQGIVSAKSETYIQTDAALSPGNSGGPMLSCDGRVVGVADRLLESRIGFGVPVAQLNKLTGKIGEHDFYGTFRPKDGAIGIAWQLDRSTFLGPYLGGSIVGYDRVSLTTRLGVLFAGKDDTSEPVIDRSVRRFFFELDLSYRMLLFPYAFPTYLSLGLGGVAFLDRGDETRLGATVGPPGCTGTGCVPTLSTTTTAIRGGGVEPIAQAVLNFGSLEGSYGYMLDVLHPSYSAHRILVGISF